MNKWWILVCSAALALGCGSSGTDMGPDDEDGGAEPSDMGEGSPLCASAADGIEFPVLMAFDGESMVAPDLSTRGTRTAPEAAEGTEDVQFTLAAVDFFDEVPVQGLMIEFFNDNDIPVGGTACTVENGCQSGTSGGDGTLQVMATPGEWYAYRILEGEGTREGQPAADDYAPVQQINELAEEGSPGVLAAVRQDTISLIANLLSVQRQPGTTSISGIAEDAAGNELVGVRLQIFDADGRIMFGAGPTDTQDFYFVEEFPNAGQDTTSPDGLYGAFNLPQPSDGLLTVVTCGVESAGAPPTVIGCEQIRVEEDGISVVNVGPLRADGPALCL